MTSYRIRNSVDSTARHNKFILLRRRLLFEYDNIDGIDFIQINCPVYWLGWRELTVAVQFHIENEKTDSNEVKQIEMNSPFIHRTKSGLNVARNK